MKSYDYDAVVYDGAEYCVECLPEGVSVSDEEVAPIFADAEVDRPVVCDHCHAVHDYMNVLSRDDEAEPVADVPTEEADLAAALDRFDVVNYGRNGETVELVLATLEARYGEQALVRAVAEHFRRTPELLVRGLREAGLRID